MSRRHLSSRAAISAVVVACCLAGARVAPATAAVPAGFRAASFSATSPRDWWLTGTVPCRFRHACLGLVRTLDGGHVFSRVPLPTLVDVDANQGATAKFANPRDGYLAAARLWVTHDGGDHWRVLDLGGDVESVATGGGFVYATVDTALPRALLLRSPVSHDDWTVLAAAPDGFEGVTVEGDTVLLDKSVTLGGEQEILISHDEGASFTSSEALPEVACAPQEPAAATVWMLCSGGMADLLYRSVDGGRAFSQPDWDGNPKDPPRLAALGHASLAAADADVAVLGSQELLRTTDGGRSFRRVALPTADGGWSLAFLNARDGLALGRFGEGADPPGRLYYTSDAGAGYRPVAIG